MINDFDELAEIASKKDPDLAESKSYFQTIKPGEDEEILTEKGWVMLKSTDQANVCAWCGETFHHVGYPYGSEFVMCSLACLEEFNERKR